MPTIRRCCIVGCMSNSRINPNLQFFQFPRTDNPFYKLWTQACQASLSRILPFKKPVLCALHFHPHCIGGRRLTSSAIPSLKLEVPTNLKAVEQQAMVEEIERSRKCAYINAVVYEWLVRANLNPQLRGSITHGMIKEKADTAKQIIGCDTFMADNRWLNRFRESHLTGFAQKLASNQLKPLGSSLWIPDITQDLQHLFPPTNAERVENFENVPEQYISYMKQYGEYEEEDDSEQDQSSSSNGYDSRYEGNNKMTAQSYYQQHQQHQQHGGYYQQHHPVTATVTSTVTSAQPPAPSVSHHQQPMSPPPPHASANGYNPYAHHSSYNSYHDYYGDRHQQPPSPIYSPAGYNGHHSGMHSHMTMPPLHQQHPSLRPLSHSSPQSQSPIPAMRPLSHSPITQSPTAAQREQQTSPVQAAVRPMQHSPPALQQLSRLVSPVRPASAHSHSSEPNDIDSMQNGRSTSTSPNNKRRLSHENGGGDSANDEPSSKRSSPIENILKSRTPSPAGEPSFNNNNNDVSFKIKLPLLNGNGRKTPTVSVSASVSASASPTPSAKSHNSHDSNSRSNSPKSQSDAKHATKITNGCKTLSPTPSFTAKELETYAQALEYLKPLEDFALFKENFRAIGLISQLECILKKGQRILMEKKAMAAN